MTQDQTDAMRAAFENWALEQPVCSLKKYKDGRYIELEMQMAWDAWQYQHAIASQNRVVPEVTDDMQEIDIPNATLQLVSQEHLCAVQYLLYRMEDEVDHSKREAYKAVGAALHEITNHRGVDGIASRELMQQYFPPAADREASND